MDNTLYLRSAVRLKWANNDPSSKYQGAKTRSRSNDVLFYKNIKDTSAVQKKETEGISFQKTSKETFFLTLDMLRNYIMSQ